MKSETSLLRLAGKGLLILAWLVIAFISIVIPLNIIDISEVSRLHKGKQDIIALSGALEQYKKDYGQYPSTDEGLQQLIHPPSANATGYLRNLPISPWGQAYHYRSPGTHLPSQFDLWTTRQTSKTSDASEETVELANWPGDSSISTESFGKRIGRLTAPSHLIFTLIISLFLGLPLAVIGIILSHLFGKMTYRVAAKYHAAIYLSGVNATTLLCLFLNAGNLMPLR